VWIDIDRKHHHEPKVPQKVGAGSSKDGVEEYSFGGLDYEGRAGALKRRREMGERRGKMFSDAFLVSRLSPSGGSLEFSWDGQRYVVQRYAPGMWLGL